MEVSISGIQPRLEKSYLRFSLPSFFISNPTEKNAILQSKKGLVVVPRGGIMITSGEKYLHATQPTIILEPKVPEDILLLLAWFKSSYFLWYCATIIGDIDLLRFLLVEINRYRIPLPNKMFFERCVNINNDVKNLILEEKKFLKEAAKLTDKDNREEMEKLTNKHNESGDSCCRSIDIDIFKYLGIRSGEAMDIYKTLKDLDVYDLRVGENKTFQDSLKALDV